MATERLISPQPHDADTPRGGAEIEANWALRPTSLDEYVGQPELIERLTIAIAAARSRGDQLEHLLLHGPPGLGKTTLAHVVANEFGTRLYTTSGPALARGTDLVSALTRLDHGDILFIDEIHRLPIAVEEFIYPAMEDFRIDVPLDTGLNARTVQIRCKPFTLIGATTRAGLLSAPLRSRFGMAHHLRYYSTDDLRRILIRSCRLLELESTGRPGEPDGLDAIAARSRGTPRISNRLLRRARDFAQVRGDGVLSAEIVDEALRLEGVDHLGLDELDRAYLRAIGTVFKGGPVGLEAVAATMNEDAGTLEDVVEPYLLQIGFLARTRRGRVLTKPAADHIEIRYSPPPDSNDNLFE